MSGVSPKSSLVMLTMAAGLAYSIQVHAGYAPVVDQPDQRGRVTGSVETGFDSFQEKYTIVDSDTVDSINEFRYRARIGYALGSSFRNYFHTEARAIIGEGNREYGSRLQFIRVLGSSSRSRIAFEADYFQRRFYEGSSFAFSNNLERLYVHTNMRLKVTDDTLLKLSHRIEHLDFEERTDFDYTYNKQHSSLGYEGSWGLSTYLNGSIRMTTMDIPDSTEIEYTSWTPEIEFRHIPELRQQVYIRSSLERRAYDGSGSRASFWTLLFNGTLERPILSQYGFQLTSDSEYYRYDVSSDAYFDHWESRNALLFNWYRSYNTKVGIGPVYAFSISEASPEDEYQETGARWRIDHNSGTRVWLSAWYEIGHRFYDTFDASLETDTESVFSNYSYHRISFYGTIRVIQRLNINAFIDYQPEDHERRGDDATATLLSVSLVYYL